MIFNGKTMTAFGAFTPAAVDDGVIEKNKLWSSKNTVDKLCPAFAESGAVVQCEPVEGYPLEVVSEIAPSLEGYTQLKLTQKGKNLYQYPGIGVLRPIANGSVIERLENGVIVNGNDGNGLGNSSYTNGWVRPGDYNENPDYLGRTQLYKDMVVTISADFTILETSYTGTTNIGVYLGSNIASYAQQTGSVNISRDVGKKYRLSYTYTVKGDALYYPIISVNAMKVKIENIQMELGSVSTAYEPYIEKTYTADFGNAVYGGSFDWHTGKLTITHDVSDGEVVELDSPREVQLDPQAITANAGVNTLYSDTGNTEVAGRADPVARLERLENAILSLGGNV